MDKRSIRKHLKPYSIFQKRRTTVNHAFASALAPNDIYDEQIMDDALKVLGQDSNEYLYCVYCGNKAQTWDHLVGLVKDAQLRGYGHQIGNLVPCCRDCNSKKGSKDWRQFIESEIHDMEYRDTLIARLETYLKRFAKPINISQIEEDSSDDWAEYMSIKKQIFELMIEADKVAERIRSKAG